MGKEKCKDKMTKSQKDNAIQIAKFLKQLSDELPKKDENQNSGNQTSLTQEKLEKKDYGKEKLKQAARAKAMKIAKEKVE